MTAADPAQQLPLGLTAEALTAADAEADPESLAASVRLRGRFTPELAAAAVTQVLLRRRAYGKFGPAAARLYFTRDGLEQATRPDVAAHHAARLLDAGVRRVVDLGCGIGTDAMAFLAAGLEVVAVDRDERSAEVARANLGSVGGAHEVRTGTAEVLWPALRDDPATAVFCDPARRTDRGRSWRIEDLSPSWPFVSDLLDGSRPAAVKLGPGLAHRFIPDGAEAEWIGHRGDTVELGLWAGAGATPGRRSAVVLAAAGSGETGVHRLVTDPTAPAPPVVAVGRYLYEPHGAILRSGALPTLARELGAGVLIKDIAYLSGDAGPVTPYATGFEVQDAFPYREKLLRQWVRSSEIGQLEILTRGLGLDPAALRRRLRLAGRNAATVIITPTSTGPKVLIGVRR